MRGITKALARAPHKLSKGNANWKVTDLEFDELAGRFATLDKCATRMRTDAESYRDCIQKMLESSAAFGKGFKKLYSPLGSEGDDLAAVYPQARKTLDTLPEYDSLISSIRETLTPEIELLKTRCVNPLLDLEAVTTAIRKNVTKRNHKLVDLERATGAWEKAKEKDTQNPKEEQAVSKAEQAYEVAKADYEYFNDALKVELPMFFEQAAKLITSLWHTIYWTQLNILYLSFRAIESFAKDKVSIDVTLGTVEADWRTEMGDAADKVEKLTIRQQFSSNKILSQATPVELPSGGALAPDEKKALDEELPPYVIALYDFTAQADGDLTFKAGDHIQLVSRTDSKEDWWTGKINGQPGVFPGNFVRDP